MKKLKILAVVMTMLLSFAACNSGGSGSTADADVTATAAATEIVTEKTTEAAETPTETFTEKSETKTSKEETTTAKAEKKSNEPSPESDFEYEENDGEITITRYTGNDTKVVIPAEIKGKPVAAIGYSGTGDRMKGAFEDKESISSVVIPEGVKTIEASAFVNCTNLTKITFPESLTEIVNSEEYDPFFLGIDGIMEYTPTIPFDGTRWLKAQKSSSPLVVANGILIDGRSCTRSVEIPEGVKQICQGAFYNGTTITSITFPDGVEKIDDLAFFGCSRLKEIILPDSVNYLGAYAFSNCSALENVTFPNNTVEMREFVFGLLTTGLTSNIFACPWLKNKTAEEPMLIINGNLINAEMCGGSIVIPDNVRSIAAYSFGDSEHWVTNVTIPNGVTKILYGTFSECRHLESVTIPDSVTEIEENAFYFCKSLKSIKIPDSVEKIGSQAFAFSGLESITIPGSVKEIEKETFTNCTSLNSAVLLEGVEKIGEAAFSDTGLTEVILPDSLKTIGMQAFMVTMSYNKNKLTEMTLPDNIESISVDAFLGNNCDITYKGEIYFPELYSELFGEINR